MRLTSSGHVVVILVNKDMLRALCEYILKDSVLICTSNPAVILSVEPECDSCGCERKTSSLALANPDIGTVLALCASHRKPICSCHIS